MLLALFNPIFNTHEEALLWAEVEAEVKMANRSSRSLQ